MKKIILASSSPRRKELLELIGIPFIVDPSQAEEIIDELLTPKEVVESLALLKAKDVAKRYPEGIIIGADTIVVLDNEILGKPVSHADAFNSLQKLQGKAHQVYSGVAIINAKTNQSCVCHQATKVFMSPLNEAEIHHYIATGEPMDKAGSYGIQGIGAVFIEKIEGDYFNVVGLPLSLLRKQLKDFQINLVTDLHLKK